LVILGILSTLAVGSYRRYAMRANRVDATTQLLRIQVAQEKRFLQAGSYANDNATMIADPSAGGLGIASATTPGGHYTLLLAAGATAGSTYLATATPAAGDGQTQDTGCQSFTINDQGTRGPTGSESCWQTH
jgi:type IV pilus assembly protein PilE